MSEPQDDRDATARNRAIIFGVVTAVVLVAAAIYTVTQLQSSRANRNAAPTVPTASSTALPTHGFIAFRHTSLDSKNGVVAVVSLDDPSGPRIFTGVACDRIYATRVDASCLITNRGVVTSYSQLQLNADWKTVDTQPLPGQPSRTRISPDGSLISSTVFVAGHSYMSVGFSTATEIHTSTGKSYGNLEKFTLYDDNKSIDPKDRNIWGVTFAPDDNTFYATVAFSGHTHLLRGDLAKRTLTIIADDVECPSLSPDGTKIAFKQATNPGGQKGWTPAWLDLATMKRTVLTAETNNVDDQIEWLDNQTILYGLPRTDQPGVDDIWSLGLASGSTPQLLIKDAWSPAVVR